MYKVLPPVILSVRIVTSQHEQLRAGSSSVSSIGISALDSPAHLSPRGPRRRFSPARYLGYDSRPLTRLGTRPPIIGGAADGTPEKRDGTRKIGHGRENRMSL